MVRGYLTHFQELSPNVKLFLIGNAIQGMGLSIYSLLFNLYLKHLGFGEGSIGSLISTSSLGIALMAIPAALIIDKFHVKHLVITGLFLCTCFYLMQIMNVDEGSLFAFGLLASMFQSLYNISVSPFYLRNSSAKQRVYLFSMNSALNMLGQFVGYFIGGFLPDLFHLLNPAMSRTSDYRAAIIASLAIVFTSNIFFLRIKKVPIPKVKKKMFDGLREKDWNIMARLILPKLCFAFGGGLIVPFINLYLKERFVFSTEMIGIAYALLQMFIFIGVFITPEIVKKTTRLRFIITTGLLAVPFMVTMGLTGNITLVMTCFFMRGILMNITTPITAIFEMEHVREKDCVFASAIILFCYHLVYTTCTRLGGYLIETYSFGPTFYVAGFFYAMAIVLYYRLFKGEEEIKEEAVSEVTLKVA